MPAAAIPLATSALGGIFSGIGAGKKRTSTSSYENESTQTANLTGKQNKMDKNLFKQILEMLKLGPNVSQSDRNTARGQINDTYDASLDNVESNLAARGFGGGGKFGSAARDLSISRAKGIQSSEATLRGEAMQRFQQMIQNAFQYNTPRSFTNTSSGTQTGTQPGTPWQSSVGGGVGDLSSYLWMRNLQGAGGGGGGGTTLPTATGSRPSWLPSPCVIAEFLYNDDWRVPMLRSWLAQRAGESWKWAAFVTAYALTGRLVVKLLRRSETMKAFARTRFDQLVVLAMA